MELSSSLRITLTTLLSVSLLVDALFLIFSFKCNKIGTRLCTLLLRSQTAIDSLLMIVNLVTIQYFIILPQPSQMLPDWMWLLYCKIVFSEGLHWSLVSMSVYNLVCIAIERCCCLCAPFWYRRHKSLLLKLFVFVVIASPSFVEFPFCWTISSFEHADENSSDTKSCAIKNSQLEPAVMNAFGISYVTLFWVLPSVLSLVLYLIVLRTIRQSSALREAPGSNVRNKKMSGATRRLTLMTGVTSAAFVLLFAMDAIDYLLLCVGVTGQYRGILDDVDSFLVNMNSAINPVMYLIFMPKFRSFLICSYVRRGGSEVELNATSGTVAHSSYN